MPSQKAVDMLNQTASSTRTSPRKRRRLDDEGLPSDNIVITPATKASTEPLRRSSRKSITKLQTPTVVRASRPAVVSNEITVHPPVSPNRRKTREDEPARMVPKRKRMLNQKRESKKSPGYLLRGKGIIFPAEGVDLVSYNSPAKGIKGRKQSLVRSLREQSEQMTKKDVSKKAPHPIQQSGKNILNADASTTYVPSIEKGEGRSDVEDDNTLEATDVEGSSLSSKSGSRERQQTRQADRISGQHTSAQGVDRERESRVYPNPSESTRQTTKPKKPLREEHAKRREDAKRIEKAKKQKTRDDNIVLSQAAATKLFDERKNAFGQGIEVQAERTGGLAIWCTMGAGAIEIENEAPKKKSLSSEGANRVWEPLMYLEKAFGELNELGNYDLEDEEAAQDAIEQLKRLCTLENLRPEGEIQAAEDPTVGELYLLIIPQFIFVLKGVLQARYVDGLSCEAVQELLSLAEIGMNLCKIAMEWTPRPSALKTGIRNIVHNHINPNLRAIKLWLADRKQYEEHRAMQQKVRANLALAQKSNRERKQKLWEERQQRLVSYHAHSTYIPPRPPSSSADIVDIDDLD